MKIPTMLLTAGLAIASLGVSVSANAQNYNGGDRHDQNYRDQRNDRQDQNYRDQRNDRHDQNYRGQRNDHRDDRYRGDWRDRGRHNGWNRHQHCWTEWHHHHRERICR